MTMQANLYRNGLRMRWIFRRDEIQGHWRIARILWERGEPGKPGGGYSAKFSIALNNVPFRRWHRDARTDWLITVFWVRLHYCRSYGGIFA